MNIMPPKAMAPMQAAEPRCPVMVVSANASSGTVMFEMMLGMAMCNICLFNGVGE